MLKLTAINCSSTDSCIFLFEALHQCSCCCSTVSTITTCHNIHMTETCIFGSLHHKQHASKDQWQMAAFLLLTEFGYFFCCFSISKSTIVAFTGSVNTKGFFRTFFLNRFSPGNNFAARFLDNTSFFLGFLESYGQLSWLLLLLWFWIYMQDFPCLGRWN